MKINISSKPDDPGSRLGEAAVTDVADLVTSSSAVDPLVANSAGPTDDP